MPPLTPLQQLHQELVRRINREARADPNSPYAGKFVGLANGQVVVVADSLDEVMERLQRIEPDPMKTACVEASADYDEVIEIWSARNLIPLFLAATVAGGAMKCSIDA